jgi:hypothetical protein
MVSEKDILARDSSSFWAKANEARSKTETNTMQLLTGEVFQKRALEVIDSGPSLIFFIFVTKVKKVKLAAKREDVFLEGDYLNYFGETDVMANPL